MLIFRPYRLECNALDCQGCEDSASEGVKNGVKKWAYAYGSGAAQAWLANELMGVATAGMSVLAGAAVGSAWGAIENATTL